VKQTLARELLAPFATGRALLAFDFDGTLAPIVADREHAVMRPRTRELFTRVCERYPVAVISGRARPDVAARLIGTAPRYVIGNHGAEPDGAGAIDGLAALEREIASVLPLLQQALGGSPGIEIEDKRYSLALHYRHATDEVLAREAIARAVTALPIPIRTTPGKRVVNVLASRARHKGDSFLALCAGERAERSLFVGDDVTDEDVFSTAASSFLGIRIGAATSSAARHFLHDQLEIDGLLDALVGLRAP